MQPRLHNDDNCSLLLTLGAPLPICSHVIEAPLLENSNKYKFYSHDYTKPADSLLDFLEIMENWVNTD